MSSTSDSSPDWPQQATETIVNLVDNVKGKTTEPATKVVRGIVYGIVIVLLGVPAVIMAMVGVVHLLNQVSTDVLDLGVWLVYLVLGVIFSTVGWIMWRKRVA
jgi:nucleoside permease NupC